MKAIALVLAFASGHVAAQASFVTIGDLPGGFHSSHTNAASSDGSFLTGMSSSVDGLRAYRWSSSTGMIELPAPNGVSNYEGKGISPNGNYISGDYGIPAQQTYLSFVWSEQTGTIPVGSLSGGSNITRLGNITDSGLAVGQSSFGVSSTGVALYRAITWTPQAGLEAMPLPDPADIEYKSRSLRVLDDGRIFGTSHSEKWLYSNETGFEMLPVGSYMSTINTSGDFMIGTFLDISSPIPHRARYWTPDTGEVPLKPYGDDDASEALYMSDNGSVIIGRGTLGWLVWLDQGQPILFDNFVAGLGVELGDWSIDGISGISIDGSTIYGSAINLSSGETLIEGFVLTIPSPATASYFAFGLIATRRKR